MLLALEGPDGGGKSTAFEQLRLLLPGARFLRVPSFAELMPHMHQVELRHLAQWEAVYDYTQLYVMDRSPFVSGNVYGSLYGRPRLDVDRWRRDVLVAYMDPGEEELRRRLTLRGDALFDVAKLSALREAYEAELASWPYVLRSIDAREIAVWARSCQKLHC